MHHALGKLLAKLVALKRIQNDPCESLLYSVCDSLKKLIHEHQGDARGAIGDICLGSLASLAIEQARHDAEAIEAALDLMVALFSNGTLDSSKHLRRRFFGQSEAGRDATCDSCLEMLRRPEQMLCDAKTHHAQLAICDVLVSPHGACPHQAPTPPMLEYVRGFDICARA